MTSDESSRHPVTRRQLALLMGALPIVARTAAALPPASAGQAQPIAGPPQTVASPTDLLAKAQDGIRKTSERLRQVELATDVEPAFVFHP
jgi:hypothetical protein